MISRTRPSGSKLPKTKTDWPLARRTVPMTSLVVSVLRNRPNVLMAAPGGRLVIRPLQPTDPRIITAPNGAISN